MTVSSRMRGVVIRLLPNKGYGFVRDTDGRTRFIHAKSFTIPGTFDMVQEGNTVDFVPVSDGHGRDGLRGIDIELVKE